MTLSLNNWNKDFDFVGWVIKTSCSSWLIYFRSVKFQYVKEIHMMLVALVKIVVASQHIKHEKNLCQDLLRNENMRTRTWKLVHGLHYANELLVRVRLAFQKLLQTRQTSKNYQNRSLLWLSIVCETHKLTRYQPEVKSFLT